MKSIGIIGSGIAGVVCAYECKKKGLDVTLFDKSRGVSGRSTTKRWDPVSNIAIDMGVPYMLKSEVKNIGKSLINELIDKEIIEEWNVHQNNSGEIISSMAYIGTPKMSSIARYLSTEINLVSQQRINNITFNQQWIVSSESDESWTFDAIVLALPAAQYDLIHGIPDELQTLANSVTYQAVNTCLIEMKSPLWFENYNEDKLDKIYIDTIIADHQKPGRENGRYTYAIHAQPSWSTKTFDELSLGDTEATIIAECLLHYNRKHSLLLKSLCHRWKYAKLAGAGESLQKGYLAYPKKELYACGDWCNGNTFAAAFESGYLLAHNINK